MSVDALRRLFPCFFTSPPSRHALSSLPLQIALLHLVATLGLALEVSPRSLRLDLARNFTRSLVNDETSGLTLRVLRSASARVQRVACDAFCRTTTPSRRYDFICSCYSHCFGLFRFSLLLFGHWSFCDISCSPGRRIRFYSLVARLDSVLLRFRLSLLLAISRRAPNILTSSDIIL